MLVAIPGIIAHSGRTHENIIDESSQCSIGPRTVSEVEEQVETVVVEAKMNLGASPWSRVNEPSRDMP